MRQAGIPGAIQLDREEPRRYAVARGTHFDAILLLVKGDGHSLQIRGGLWFRPAFLHSYPSSVIGPAAECYRHFVERLIVLKIRLYRVGDILPEGGSLFGDSG